MVAAMTEQEAITAIMQARIRAIAERYSYPASTVEIAFNTGDGDDPVEVSVRMVRRRGHGVGTFCRAVGSGQTISDAAEAAVDGVENKRIDGWEVEPS